jgi:HAE1 family hydrophobic/amphiphilic exporter-1
MKILQITIFTLILGVLTAFGQTAGSKIEIAKNSPENNVKRSSTAAAETPAENGRPAAENPAGSIPAPPLLKRVGVDNEQTTSLSLGDAIRKALENNNDIEIARQDVKIAESGLRSLLGFYDPVFTIEPLYTHNVQPVTSTFGGADLSGSTRSKVFSVNSDVVHNIKPGGGNYRVFFNNDRTKTSATFAQFNPTFNTNLGFSYVQPLFRNFRVDATRRSIRIQRKRVSQSDADFRRQTIEIIAQVQRTYWDLVFALRDQQNKVANVNLAKENLRKVEAMIKAGASAPLDRAQVNTELANREADVLLAAQQVSITENTLKTLIIRDPTSPEWSAQYVPTDRPVFGEDAINLDAVVKDAIDNRPELSRLKFERDINDIDISYFKNQLKPRIDFNTSFSLIGLAGTPGAPTGDTIVPLISGNPLTNPDAFLLQQLRILNPGIVVPNVTVPSSVPPAFIGGYGKSLSNLFSGDFRNFNVGVTISFPLRNQTARADLATAESQRTRLEAQTRSQEQTVISEVRNAVQGVETARQRIFTTRRARENAEIQLEGERKLFEQGRSTTFLLFQRENELTNAKNAEIRAETDYNKALADLQRATSTTLAINNVQVTPPVNNK